MRDRRLLTAIALLLVLGFAALGTWQVQRLAWKRDLMARVGQRVNASAIDAPGPANWAQVTRQSDEYRRVRVTGAFLYSRSTAVQAVTELGSGFWLLTPLRRTDGSMVLINRGFVSQRPVSATADATELITVTGLLRISEPGGAFLRDNDPGHERWYSRDVAAIAAARGLGPVAPFFIDLDRASQPRRPAGDSGVEPISGLTVIAFSNNHLVYALTWYALAWMVAGGWLIVVRRDRR
jgi:surfeit locus 1 family protein